MKDGIKSVIVLTVICVTVSLLVALTNSFTAPVIKSNKDAAATESLKQVLENAANFEKLEKPLSAPETVQEIYRETGGLGYAVTVAVTTSYSSSPMLYTVGISSEGKITGIVITSYTESKDFGKDTYPKSYIGLDSALNGAELVSGVTYSSTAFKKGIEDVFATLIDMGLIGEGEKSDEQKLKELFDKVLPGANNQSGTAVLKALELDAGSKFKNVFEAANGAGYILVTTDNKVITVNPFGSVAGYDIDGNPIDLENALKNDAAGAVPNNSKEKEQADVKALKKLTGEKASFTPAQGLNTVSTVTNAFIIQAEGEILYGFVSRPIGYNNGSMEIYGVITEDGKIKDIKVSEIILYSQYYEDYELDESGYYESLTGKTADTLTDEDTLISGATISGNAVNGAIKDMFNAFEEITKGGKE